MRVGRNEPCPCGSGRKYKSCCEGKARSSRGLMLLLAAMAILALIGIGSLIAASRAKTAVVPAAAAGGGVNRPQPGPAPPGKVWSAEHGHWHDQRAASGAPAGAAPPAVRPPQPQFTPKPQPPGPVPAGKEWSTEHGHWHDKR